MGFKIVIISDTHELHDKLILPDGDILIHAGDFTNRGTIPAIGKFLNWFSSQSHKYKCFVMGNHELGTDSGPTRDLKLRVVKDYTEKYNNFFYLENSSVNIDGLSIFGSPVTPWFYDWAWNVHRGPEIAKVWDHIPDDTHVLITHGPPRGILDLVDDGFGKTIHEGCDDLLQRIDQLSQLKLHIFGHLHYSGGKTEIKNGKIFANAAMCDDRHSVERHPLIIEI